MYQSFAGQTPGFINIGTACCVVQALVDVVQLLLLAA
jgi:hypothetical protein